MKLEFSHQYKRQEAMYDKLHIVLSNRYTKLVC